MERPDLLNFAQPLQDQGIPQLGQCFRARLCRGAGSIYPAWAVSLILWTFAIMLALSWIASHTGFLRHRDCETAAHFELCQFHPRLDGLLSV